MGGISGGKKKEGIMISMYSAWGHREGCATPRRQAVILQHLTTLMDSDCEGVCGRDLVKGVPSKHHVLSVIVD